MKSIIEELYYGTILPFAEININTAEYRNQMKKLLKTEQQIMEYSPEIRKTFEQYQAESAKLSSIITYHQFLCGFKAGAQIVFEALTPFEKSLNHLYE